MLVNVTVWLQFFSKRLVCLAFCSHSLVQFGVTSLKQQGLFRMWQDRVRIDDPKYLKSKSGFCPSIKNCNTRSTHEASMVERCFQSAENIANARLQDINVLKQKYKNLTKSFACITRGKSMYHSDFLKTRYWISSGYQVVESSVGRRNAMFLLPWPPRSTSKQELQCTDDDFTKI